MVNSKLNKGIICARRNLQNIPLCKTKVYYWEYSTGCLCEEYTIQRLPILRKQTDCLLTLVCHKNESTCYVMN